MLNQVDLDELTKSNTVFTSFKDLLSACQDGYIPTLIKPDQNVLADALQNKGYKSWRGVVKSHT